MRLGPDSGPAQTSALRSKAIGEESVSGNYEPMELTGGQALVAQLLEEGVTDIFGIPGI